MLGNFQELKDAIAPSTTKTGMVEDLMKDLNEDLKINE